MSGGHDGNVTGKAVRAMALFLCEGMELECIQNDYIPQRAGMRVKITKPGRTSLRVKVTREPAEQVTNTKILTVGETYWITPPKSVRDFVRVDAEQLAYRLPGGEVVRWAVLA